jgi:hypothetical protein
LEVTSGATNFLAANITTIVPSIIAGSFTSGFRSALSGGDASSKCDS